MKRAIFIGRFQPVHLGHIEAIKDILKENDELVIVIGSAQYSHTLENPFTAGERYEMLRRALSEAGLDMSRILIVPVPDVGYHSIWVSHLKSLTPPFHVIYTNNPLVTTLFREAGYEVRPIKMYRRDELVATKIRKMMLEGGDWRSLVPKKVAEFIDEIKGIERLKTISGSDSFIHSQA